jgi:hypothetical protein
MPRPAPPPGLTPRERRQWREIVGALRPDWFEAENLPLLAEYIRTAELCTRFARELRKIDVLDRNFALLSRRKLMAVNILRRLATKLRLTVQASTTTRTNKHAGGSGLPKPWDLCGGRKQPDGEPFGWN